MAYRCKYGYGECDGCGECEEIEAERHNEADEPDYDYYEENGYYDDDDRYAGYCD